MGLWRQLKVARFGTAFLGRMRTGRKAVAAHLASPDRAPVPMPTFVQLRLTNLCNLRCRMCGQWGDTGIYRHDGTDASAGDGEAERARIRELVGARRQLGLADWVRLLDEIAPSRPIVSLFGGEPLLYPEVVPLMREVKRRGLTLAVITNAWKLPDLAAEMVAIGVDSIAVSIDGPPDVHDRIRGRAGSFARAVEGVREVARHRARLGKALPMQIAILPITELNLGDIGRAVEALRDEPLDTINVGLRWFIPKEVGADYERVMRSTFGVAGDSWKGFEFTWPGGRDAANGREMAELVRLLKKLRRRRLADAPAGRPWVTFLPDVAPDDVPAWFSDYGRTFGHEMCPVAWYFAQVEPDGQVCFCGDFPDYVIGNVRERPFREIWLGEKARAFRARLAAGPLPVCARCCGSYVYGRWERPKAVAHTDARHGAASTT